MGRNAAVSVAVVCAIGCSNGRSVPGSTCGAGTHDEHGTCVVDVTCGPGTRQVGSLCLPAVDGGVTCGPGTHPDRNACISDPVDGGASCGPGTVDVGGRCAPLDDGGLACGPGTHEEGSTCVPDPIDAGVSLSCGPGTADVGGVCLALDDGGAPPVGCGPGTVLVGNQCVPALGDGGTPGTVFLVRAAVTTVPADGYSPIPVLAIGTDAGGNPSLDTVVLATSRTGAGTITPSTVTLTPTGATVYFTPCSAAASQSCAGPVQITLALASDPATVLAQSQVIDLVAPTGIGSDAPCLAGGNVIFFDGDPNDYIFSGMETITQGNWSAQASTSNVHVHVDPMNQAQGLWWDLYFDSSMLPMPALATQVYMNAERWPFESPNHPGLDVSGDGRGCNTVTGSFQVEDLQYTNGALTSFTATFEHHCEGGVPALRGCVHYGM
jgi:hypothetical protein